VRRKGPLEHGAETRPVGGEKRATQLASKGQGSDSIDISTKRAATLGLGQKRRRIKKGKGVREGGVPRAFDFNRTNSPLVSCADSEVKWGTDQKCSWNEE